MANGLTASLGKYVETVNAAIERTGRQQVVERIWQKDASLWKSDPAHQQIISNSLGWLEVPAEMRASAKDLNTFADQIRQEFAFVVLCGMGGSSLCPEVLRQTFGPQPGRPELLVLDSTDPDVIAAVTRQIDLDRTLFIIASKSGTTTEPLTFYKYWYALVGQRKANPGNSFVAITDPGTKMVEMATRDKFRRIFLNRADIGGRYSALSYFGLVPAALMGVDLMKLLDGAERIAHACSVNIQSQANPGVLLGTTMGECAKSRRDKLTLIVDRRLAALGLWIEQLVAESTGKEGQGIIPVNQEPLGPPEVYGEDRVFVSISVGELDSETRASLKALETAGHPIVYRKLNDAYDLGEEFFLWEFATAIAGWMLEINPFDQPNVQESKDATRELLDYFTKHEKLPEPAAMIRDGGLSVFTDQTAVTLSSTGVSKALSEHLARVNRGDYISLLVYVEETPEIEATLQTIREYLRDATVCATTVGYGPRFLHSTGQLHKGGPDTGLFIQLTAPDRFDLPIPGEPYTFSILKQAQALGDFRALSSRGRRLIRVDVGEDPLSGLERLQTFLEEALPVSGVAR
jgi:transaldolase / glucose-6-phosphate isomerase